MRSRSKMVAISAAFALAACSEPISTKGSPSDECDPPSDSPAPPVDAVDETALDLVDEGRRIFRFDTFGDEAFWGGQLRLHEAIVGAALGGMATDSHRGQRSGSA